VLLKRKHLSITFYLPHAQYAICFNFSSGEEMKQTITPPLTL
jgi:hypothetical protein